MDLSKPYETTNVTRGRLSGFDAESVREGLDATSLDDARNKVENLAEKMSAEGAP